jgi:twinkle protein
MAELLNDDIDFEAYLHATDAQANVKPAKVWMDELIHAMKNPSQVKKIHLPWEKTRGTFDFRAGEVTLWAGQNGHGKSLVTSQVCMSLIHQGLKVCIASFEMKPTTTLQRMARNFCNMNPFSYEFQNEAGFEALEDLYKQFGMWTDGKLWLYDQQGTADAKRVIGMTRYCAVELGVTHIVIDSLMKCVKGEDDYNGQKEFLDELCSLARDHQVHVHLVHHTRKPQNENHVPDKYDNKGSGSITDQVDNVMMVWRNKGKEDCAKAGKKTDPKMSEPDAMVLCRKQRNGDDEPTIKLWFHKDSQQYLGDPTDAPFVYQLESGRWTV